MRLKCPFCEEFSEEFMPAAIKLAEETAARMGIETNNLTLYIYYAVLKEIDKDVF